MTRKLLGLAVLALFCVGMASAGTLTEPCTGGGPFPGPGAPLVSGDIDCPVLSVAYVVTEIDLDFSFEWTGANPGGNTLSLSFVGDLPSGTATETVTGSGGSSSAPYVVTSGCVEVGFSATIDCEFGALNIPANTAIGPFDVIYLGAWAAGSNGLTSSGAVTVDPSVTLTYTPEPASLLMIGSGLIGLAMLAYRKARF